MPDRSLRILSQGEIEAEIADLSDALADETHRYADVSESSAGAEADFKLKWAREYVAIADRTAGQGRSGPTVDEKQSRCDLAAEGEFRNWKIMDARMRASKEALLSLRARLDALRTLSANVRQQT